MVKLFIYKDYDIVEELENIWKIPGNDGYKKDAEILKLINNIKAALEVTLKK